MSKFIFFQPDYVKNFKCDGKRCGADCCRRWIIYIDQETYDTYAKIEQPKGAITNNFRYDDKEKKFVVNLDEKNSCPFLTAENLCGIQKNYGEKFLSCVCQTFPRQIIELGDIFECSLSLACPIAAELALNPASSMDFALIEKSYSDDLKVGVRQTEFGDSSAPQIFEIQTTAISILQERNLTPDQRLAVLGLFLDGLEEIINSKNFPQFIDLIKTFTSKKFITETALNLLSDVTFKPKDFIRLMFVGVLENLYKETSTVDKFEALAFDAINKIFKLQPNSDGTISISAAAENLAVLTNRHEKFCERFAILLENYLVNEFFINFYPWHVKKSIRHNYALFVATYKLTENFLFALEQNFPDFGENEIIKYISKMARNIDHTAPYLEKISHELEDKENIFKVISTLLQI
ncbi:MAG: flagellin lysine-N-methylase [Selenomonadaceae bacterium]|nr:flagellin lysine-N-methylase [Selenomonadaceae bacterium]